MNSEQPRTASERLVSIDMLRGIVMALMAVDHVRDFVSPLGYDITDMNRTSVGFFLTRWVTHFCAPVFVLLAGVGVGLWARRVGDLRRVRGFLVKRGLWLIAVELLIINPLWMWSLIPRFGYLMIVQVIWAIGVSMLFLAAALFLRPRWILGLGLLIICGHHLLDGIQLAGPPGTNGPKEMLWMLLHEPGGFVFLGRWLTVIYPLIPWIGVILVGWCLAPVFALEPRRRDSICRRLGLGLILGFVLLRLSNVYGDPSPWEFQERGAVFGVLSFLNCTKYPASLLYLMMTLGPALLVLPILQRSRGPSGRFFVTLGQVPLFYYLLHIGLIGLIGAGFSSWKGLPLGYWSENQEQLAAHGTYEPSLGRIWLISFLLVLFLFPLCRWFARVKRTHSDWWLRYL